MKMNRKLLTVIVVVLFAATACFTACITTNKQAGVSSEAKGPSVVSSVALIPFWGPDKNINDQFEKEVYAAMKNMKRYNPVPVNTVDTPIPYEIPDPSLIGSYDYALTGELRRNPDDSNFWYFRLYLWKEKRLIYSANATAYDRKELAEALPGLLEWLFSWIPRREAPARNATSSRLLFSRQGNKIVTILASPASPESPATKATVSSVALVPFWGSNQNIIDQFGAELYVAVGNMKDFQPVRIDMTKLPDDVPEGGFPPFIGPTHSLIKSNPLALTGEVTRTDTGSLTLRLYLWEMADQRLVFTSTLTARNMSEYRLLLPGLLEKLFLQLRLPPAT
jgi:hypothetical protein